MFDDNELIVFTLTVVCTCCVLITSGDIILQMHLKHSTTLIDPLSPSVAICVQL